MDAWVTAGLIGLEGLGFAHFDQSDDLQLAACSFLYLAVPVVSDQRS